jgi:hypothetical protein
MWCNLETNRMLLAFNDQVQNICSTNDSLLMGIYGIGLLGIILIVVAVVILPKSKEKST